MYVVPDQYPFRRLRTMHTWWPSVRVTISLKRSTTGMQSCVYFLCRFGEIMFSVLDKSYIELKKDLDGLKSNK